jgi:RNA polymerase sigma-70 factor (ECF subfamily)
MSQALVAQQLMRHRTQLFAYLLAAVRNPHDAEDLLQETALAASASWAQWRPDGPFLPWAREIARRRMLDFAKKRGRRAALLDPAVLAALESAAATLDAERPEPRREALRRCMDGLDGPVRTAMELRYADRAEVPRIADELGRTVQATYAILKRTKQILRDCVERRLASEAP